MALLYGVEFNNQTRALSFSDRAGNNIYSCTIPASHPLTFVSTEDGSTIWLFGNTVVTVDSIARYEVDTGNGWTAYSISDQPHLTLNRGESCRWRCSNRAGVQTLRANANFGMTGSFEAYGNIHSMLIPNFENVTSLADYPYAFCNLFKNCTSLKKAPALPATTLSEGCYRSLFEGAGIVYPPKLPATALASHCYYNMFYRCTALIQAPELPATTLADSCYYSMFSSCTSLVNAPVLPATTLAQYCYNNMFSSCTSLVNAPVLPATTLAQYCYNNMFSSCTSLVNAPSLPATTLAQYCYNSMFNGCTSLVNAPALPATTLAQYCYNSMFNGCTSLVNAPALPATTLAYSCYYSMFSVCSSLTQAPELPATTLADRCYYSMFYGCSLLTEVYIAATTMAYNALTQWLSGVAAHGTVYADPSLTLPTDSISGVPVGWVRAQLPGTRSIETEPEPVLRSTKKTKPRFDPYLIP